MRYVATEGPTGGNEVSSSDALSGCRLTEASSAPTRENPMHNSYPLLEPGASPFSLRARTLLW